MSTTELFEKLARPAFPNLRYDRSGDRYTYTMTQKLYEGFLLCLNNSQVVAADSVKSCRTASGCCGQHKDTPRDETFEKSQKDTLKPNVSS